MIKKSKDLKPEVLEEEIPSLITINEFIGSVGKEHPVESLGSFIYWIKKQGMPKRWPIRMWREKFNEFLNRKV